MSAPPPFLATPGDPPIPWKQWKKIFNTYMLAIGSDRYALPRQQAILLHHLGIEGRRIYENLPEVSLGMGDSQPTNVFDMSIQMLDTQFTPKNNLVLQRHKFFSRVHRGDEDIASYVASLRGLALSCNFDQLLDSLIRDQLARCAYDKKIREKLLMRDPNLEEAIQIAKRMEHTAIWLQEREGVSKEMKQGIVAEIKKKEEPLAKVEWNKLTRNSEGTKVNNEEKRRTQEWREIKCYRCDAPGNIASSRACAARNAICRNCGRRGHFAKVCRFRSNAGNKSIQEIQDVCETMEDIILTVHGELTSHNDEGALVQEVKKESTDVLEKPHAQVMLDNVLVKLLVDLGSLFTLISKEVYESEWTNPTDKNLAVPDIKAVGYAGKRIKIVGMRWMSISFEGRIIRGKVYITDYGTNLLGWRHQKDLGIILNPNAREPVLLTNEMNIGEVTESPQHNLFTTYPEVFSSELGLLKGFSHKIILKKNITPVVHKVRNVPNLMREPLKQELEKLLKDDINNQLNLQSG
ncbi:hypothetical protein NDU88_004241 [Pleurodeles waltl]|uniref:CCHC-type domain-containing protein n=1 Tax=Pleurodeles waltl TaxID=8319 RepID=A0AAV7T7U6_PLEWA|nr:hypothetical protein NDU88_004241 [Pleurodeles waltl]